MPNDARDILIAGLKDAYAMEKQALDMMASQAERLEDYPMLRDRAASHRLETEQQIVRLERALDLCGESPSALKNMGMRAMGGIQSMMSANATDEPVKDSIIGYAFEHLEIAAYRNLIIMAEMMNENEIAELARQSLEEEIEMAEFLDENMDEVGRLFMERMASDVQGRTGAEFRPYT